MIPSVLGRRDAEWLIVEIGEIQVHFFTDTFRAEIDLIRRWTTPPDTKHEDWVRRVEAKFYAKKKL